MFANLKCLGLQTLVPLKKKKYGCDNLRDKDHKIVTVNIFKMMTKLLSQQVRSPLKNVFKNKLRSQHSDEALKKQYTVEITTA